MGENADALAVDQLLTQANLTLSADDRAVLIEVYPRLRNLVQRLRNAESRYTRPAPVYPIIPQPVVDLPDGRGTQMGTLVEAPE